MKKNFYQENYCPNVASFGVSVRLMLLSLTFLLFLLSLPQFASAQCEECDHWITTADVSDNNLKIITYDAGPSPGHNVQPGDIICFQAMLYNYTVRIKNVNGQANNRITIKNCGGQTIIDNNTGLTDLGYHALDIIGSEYFDLVGVAGSGYDYGIKIAASQAHGLSVAGFSTEFDVSGLEIANTEGCGVNSKTDPNCSNRDLRSFTQRNSFFHDNYLHDIGSEGFYVGYTHYPENPHVTCGGSPAVFYGHPMENIRIYNNVLERIGWDGIQVGGLATGNQIYNNTIRDYATLENGVHIHAIQLSGNGDQCDVFGNKILPSGSGNAGKGSAVAVWASRTKIYNNLFVRTGYGDHYAVQVYDESTDTNPKQFWVYNNTIIEPSIGGVSMFNAGTAGKIVNNIIIQAAGNYIEDTWTGMTYDDNYEATSTAGANFTSDYHLTENSPPAIMNAGTNLYADGVTTDVDGDARPASGAFDIGYDEFYEGPGGGKTVKINFRGTTPAYSDPAWNDWNAMPTTTNPAPAFNNLKYTDGTSSNYNIVITQAFSGANALGMTGAGAYPSEVMQTNWYVHNNTPNAGIMKLTGLDNSKKYSFTFFGSREDATGTTNRNTNYTIGTTTVTLNASNNTTGTVSIEEVSPTNGEIVVSVKYGTGATFGYINAMEVTEVPDAVVKNIKLNFRGTTPAYTNAEWNDWNAMPTTTNPAPTFTNLKYDDGTSSNYNITITQAFSGANGLGMSSSGIYPSEVMQTNWYVHNNTPNAGILKLTGLNNSKNYSFTFFGSREDTGGTTNRNTNYTIGSTTVTLNASNNTSSTVSINNVAPTNGEIIISVKYGTGATFGYINAMEILEQDGSGMMMMSMAPEQSAESVSAYPVPFDNKITLSFPENVKGKVSVSLTDFNGRHYFKENNLLIPEEEGEEKKIELDLSNRNIPRGLYIIRLQTAGGYRQTIHVNKN